MSALAVRKLLKTCIFLNYFKSISLSIYYCKNYSFLRPAIFYKEPDANGFHLSSGSHYVYPSNFPVREYQMGIIKTALFHNTLVSLPTGIFICIIYFNLINY